MTGSEAAPVVSPSIRARRKAFTRDRLLEAAEELFRRQGFDATSVDEITRTAGTSRATFYLHFEQKVDVAAALADAMWDRAEQFFRRLTHLPDWTEPVLRAWIETDVADWDAQRATMEALSPPTLTERPEDMISRVEAIAAAMVDDAGPWSRWSREEAVLRATMVIDVLVARFRHWERRGFLVDEDGDLGFATAVVARVLVDGIDSRS